MKRFLVLLSAFAFLVPSFAEADSLADYLSKRVAGNYYYRLDGSNGPLEGDLDLDDFDIDNVDAISGSGSDPITVESLLVLEGDIRSSTTDSCADYTTITLDGSPFTYNETVYDDDVMGSCSGCSTAVLTEIGVGNAMCCDGVADDMSGLFTGWGTHSDVDVCLIYVPDFPGGAKYLTVVTDDGGCAAEVTKVEDAIGTPGTTNLDDSATVFAWNSNTCEYETTIPEGWTVTATCTGTCSGNSWPSTPTIATDSEPIYNWSIDESTGNIQSVGTVSIGGTIDDNDRFYVEHAFVDVPESEEDAPILFNFVGSTTNSDTGHSAIIFQGANTLAGAGDYTSADTMFFSTSYTGTGSLANSGVGRFYFATDGTGTVTDTNVLSLAGYVLGDGDITEFDLLKFSEPSFDSEDDGVITTNVAVRIENQSSGSDDDTDRVGTGYGIYIEEFEDQTNDWGFYNLARSYLGENTHIADGKNIVLDTTTGTKIGTGTTQKLAFYDASPVTQQTGTTDPSADAASNNAAIIVILDALENLGLIVNND